MLKKLNVFSEETYAALRLVAGLMFAFHGAQKVLGVMTDHQPPMFTQIWIGGLIELVGGLLIAIGLKTRPAAFLCSGTMAVAYTQFHWKLAMGQGFFPAINQGELALLYAFLFLFIACKGSGSYAVGRD